MKIEISVFAICIIVFVLNTVLDHVFNWWVRNLDIEDDFESSMFFLINIAKPCLIISLLYQITK